MKIVFLNVWGGKAQDTLVEFIQDQARDTDIFCFQEATDEMKDLCKDALAGYKQISDYKFITQTDDFPQSMFIRNEIEIISSGTLFAQDMDCGLSMYVEVKVGSKNLYICNVHGISRPVDKMDTPGRLKQSKGIVEFFKNKDSPIVIGGDFNMSPATESIEMFEKHGYRDLIKEFDIDTTRNHLVWDRYPGNKLYYSDYVFLNEKVQLTSFSVPKNEVSDHLPMLLEIQI